MKVLLGFLLLSSLLELIKSKGYNGPYQGQYPNNGGYNPWQPNRKCPALNRPDQITTGMTMDRTLGNARDMLQFWQPDTYGRNCYNTSGGITCPAHSDYEYEDNGCNCARDCTLYPDPRVCYWRLFSEQYTCMGPACGNCSSGKIDDCYNPECVVGVGIEKTIDVFNRLYPAPLLSVCKGDLIVADLGNLIHSDAVTIHWHGMLQEETPFMDGVPWLTQCPIPPGGQFRYKFRALTVGTLWYHTHQGNLLDDGLKGGFVVRQPKWEEPENIHYDYDLDCHVIFIDDWFKSLYDDEFPGKYKNTSETPIQIQSYSINGLGDFDDGTTKTNTPHFQMHVKYDKTYRVRVIIGAASVTCDLQMAIEGHSFQVVALDGSFVNPVDMKVMTIGSGERVDILIKTKSYEEIKKAGKCSYYMVVRATGGCVNTTLPQKAYFVYDCCDPKPTHPLDIEYVFSGGPRFNDFSSPCNETDNVCSYETRSPEKPTDPRVLWNGECEHREFFEIAGFQYTYEDLFENKTNKNQPYYMPVGFIPPAGGVFIDTVNNCTMMTPIAPLLTEPWPIPAHMTCYNKCNMPLCNCMNIVKVPANHCMEVVVMDNIGLAHPIHIHGYAPYFLKQGSAEERQQPNFWLNVDKTDYPPKRDVFSIPLRGYIVLRFVGTNYGYWNVHCHFQAHNTGGMAWVFKVGEREQFKKIPKDFPKCGPWLPPAPEVCDYGNSCPYKGDNNPYANMSGSDISPVTHGKYLRYPYNTNDVVHEW